MPKHLLLLLASAAIAIVLIVIVLLPGMRLRIDRGYRHPHSVQWAIVASASFLLIASLAGIAFAPNDAWEIDLVLIGLLALAGAVIVALSLKRTPATVLRPRRILAVGAHPDDLELACGATLAKLVDEGHEVVTLVMSRGASGGDSSVRVGEAHRGSRYLGASATTVMDHADTELRLNERELVRDIERMLARYKPDLVLTHSAHDYHQDHSAVHDATMRAARNHPSILCFESPSATRQFNPDFFVDVSEHVHIKVRAVELHRDQQEKPYMSSTKVRAAAAFRGSQAKVGFAEGFEVMRLNSASVGDF